MKYILTVLLTFLSWIQLFPANLMPPGYRADYTGPVIVDCIEYYISPSEKVAVVTDDYFYKMDNYGAEEIPSWQESVGESVEIPPRFVYEEDTYTVIGIDLRWASHIKEVKLPPTIKYIHGFIGQGGTWNGGELVLPEQLIAMEGFCQTCFESISFPETFTTFSAWFGGGNECLREFVMPPMVTEIPEFDSVGSRGGFLSGCPALVHLDLGNKIEVIPFESFTHLPSLKTIRIPESVKVIAKAAFNYCSGVEEIYLPTHPIELGESFLQLTNLRRIHVPCAEPYDISRYSFPDTDFGECVVIVPDGCAEGYASRTGWNRFRIIEESQAGAVSPEESGVPVRWVDMEGRRVGSLAPGQPGIRIEGDRRTKVIGR